MSKEVYITYAKRSPIGKFKGALAGVRVDDLLATLFEDVLQTLNFDPALIDDILVGCANQAGEDNRNLARMSALLAGIPHQVPATTLNRLCGSSLDALGGAWARIQAGFGECMIVAGAESMSRAPYVLSKAQDAFDRTQKIWDTSLGWRFPNPRMEKLFPLYAMGETAEEVARLHGISREDQDAFALLSHQRAYAAQQNGDFAAEILPIPLPPKSRHQKEQILLSSDEGPRADTNLEKLKTLKPAFSSNGTVTAGNSSSINDGAACLLVASDRFIKEHHLTPLARITGFGVRGCHPNTMGLGPIFAVQDLCQKFRLSPDQFDLVELNEAFAAQSLACLRELKLDPERVNPRGGAIALGHPLGCSGARITTTLIHQLQADPKRQRGLATMCIGLGQGVALSLERC